MSDVLGTIGVVLLLLLAALAAMAETWIVRLGRVRAHRMAQERRSRGSDLVVRIVEDPAPYLTAVLFLGVLAYLLAAALGTALLADTLEVGGTVGAAALMAVGIFVLCCLVPKTVTLQRMEGVARVLAGPVFVVGKLLRPLTKLFVLVSNALMMLLPGGGLPKGPFSTEEELRLLTDADKEEEEIEEEERELIHSIFEFGDTIVREVMVPRTDMIAISSRATLEESLETITKAGYSRIPIFEGDTDNIVGVLYAKDLLKRTQELQADTKVQALGRAPLFVPEQKKVADLLREMQEQRVHMAIVVDEYGGTAGLVTIEDVIEEIVGEIVDEYDQEEPLVEPLDDNTIRVDAKMPIDEVNELLGAELPHEEWDTVGGLVFGMTGRVPVPGERVRYDSLEFLTERVSGRRIQKVVIAKLPEGDEGGQ